MTQPPTSTINVPDEVIPESLRGRPDAFGREVAAGEAQRWIDAWCERLELANKNAGALRRGDPDSPDELVERDVEGIGDLGGGLQPRG